MASTYHQQTPMATVPTGANGCQYIGKSCPTADVELKCSICVFAQGMGGKGSLVRTMCKGHDSTGIKQ